MRQSLQTSKGALLFVLIAIVLSAAQTRVASSRPLQSPSLGTGALNNVQTQHSFHTEELSGEDLRKLMGEEKSCEDIRDDEECLKRMIYEAHLDYIYTQSHEKP